MNKNFFFLFVLWGMLSCNSDSIPSEVDLSDESREFVADYCECMEKNSDENSCMKDARKSLKIHFERMGEEEKKTFLKEIVHALIESDCFEALSDQQIDQLINGN